MRAHLVTATALCGLAMIAPRTGGRRAHQLRRSHLRSRHHNVGLGAACGDTAYYVFATTDHNRIGFCGSPRRYGPRYFGSPPMVGIKNLGDNCIGYENDVAQAPDGLFLFCGRDEAAPQGSPSRWVRGDL